MTLLSNNQPKLIPGRTLATLLRVAQETVRSWRRRDELESVGWIGGGSAPDYRYNPAAINTLLAAKAHNFDTPPTVEALLSGELTVLTAKEAGQLIDRSERIVLRLIKDGRLAAIQLSERGDMRVSRQSVERHITASRTTDGLYTPKQAQHVLSSQWTALVSLARRGELVMRTLPNDKRQHYITAESLEAVVKARLPKGTTDDPVSWIEDALDDPRRPYHSPEVMRELGCRRRGYDALLATNRVRYLVMESGYICMPISVDAYREHEGQVPFKDISTVLGVDVTTLRQFRRDNLLVCPLGHDDYPLYRGCIVAILDAGMHWHSSGAHWYEWRLAGKLPLVSVQGAARQLNRSILEVKQLAEEGVLTGLQLPNGEWRLLARRVTTVAKQKRR